MKNATDTVTTSSRLKFFVRLLPICKTLVILASTQDTVESILRKISSKTKFPIESLRLVYSKKQLQREQSLGECGIKNDETLQLVSHLRSVRCAKLWSATDDIASLIFRLLRGEDLNILNIPFLTIQAHFMNYMDNAEYYDVFRFMKIPNLLVNLYMFAPNANCKIVAEKVIKEFLQVCLEMKNKVVQICYVEAVLEFCELLRGVGCRNDDVLYVLCRDRFATLFALVGGVTSFESSKWRVLLQGISVFVHELADGLLRYLDLGMACPTSEGISCSVVWDFMKFLTPLRKGIVNKRPASREFEILGFCCEEDHWIAEVVDGLRILFIQLLIKMDRCLQVMENCLVSKEQKEGDRNEIHDRQSHYLFILRELHHMSMLYSGGEERFWEVLLRRKSMLSHLIVRYADTDDNHRWVLENMSVTDFKSRRHLAMTLFPAIKHEILGYEMLIERSQVLTESFEYISRAKPKYFVGDLYVEFKNEEATGPGVLREWFVLVCKKIFNPKNALFVACPNDHRRFFPNAASKVNPLHLKYFSFSGRMIALALKNNVHVGIVFDRVFFKQLAGNNITLEDIQDADPLMYHSCKQILEMNADYIDSDALGLTFSIEVEELGHKKVIELCPGGESLVVDSKNREKYVDLLIQNRFVTSISEQVSHFAEGFTDIISGSRLDFFRFLNLEDLDWMLHGSEIAISVEDWKAHTKYTGYKEIDNQITWFWEIVERMSEKQKKVLLFFWTSVKHLPVEGFHGLETTLAICKTKEPDNHLPSSHTCFYQLCFPPYSSMGIMQDRLGIITQEHIGCSFGTL